MSKNSDSYEVTTIISRKDLLQKVQDYFAARLAEQHGIKKEYIGAMIYKERLSDYFDKNIKRFEGKNFDYKKAIEYYTRSLQICIQSNDVTGTANAYNNIGALYQIQKDHAPR